MSRRYAPLFLYIVSGLSATGMTIPAYADENLYAIVERAVADTTRPDAHVARDAARMPEKVLKVSGIKPGDKVADLGTFGGYYTALISRIVGPTGAVYSSDYGLAIKQLPQFRLGRLTPSYLKADPRENVIFDVVDRFEDLTFPEPIDNAIIALNYHDTLWTGENRPQMNTTIFNAIRPGGRLIVIDHAAKAGAGADIANAIHRVDPELVKREVTAAGFNLLQEYDFLSNAADPKDIIIVDPSVRGKTDRFVFVFQKPE